MGTHPIFESDFDCLTECFLESPPQSPVFQLDLPDTVSPSLTNGSASLFQLSLPCSSMANSQVLSPQPRLLLQKPTRKKKKTILEEEENILLSKLFALKY